MASDETGTVPAPGSAVAASKTVTVSHEAHHFVFVFNRAPVTIPPGWSGRGAVNVVLRANNSAAKAGHCLLVGANKPDGTVQHDMGGISVGRIRGQLPAPLVIRESRLRNAALKIHDGQPPRVLYSMELAGLRAHDQFTVYGRALASTAGIRTRARLSARVFLADSPTQLDPQDGYAAEIAANKGRVAKSNGFNYLPGGSGPPTEKVGVLHIVKTMKARKTVYLNFVGDGRGSEQQVGPQRTATATERRVLACALLSGGDFRLTRTARLSAREGALGAPDRGARGQGPPSALRGRRRSPSSGQARGSSAGSLA